MSSSVQAQSPSFRSLAAVSEQSLHQMHASSPEIQQVFAEKHFCATLPADSHCLLNGSRRGEQMRTSFGSSYLYFLSMKRAANELLQNYDPKTWGFKVLTAWKDATKPYQKLSAIDNYFRVQIPGNFDRISEGRAPVAQMTPPTQGVIHTIARYIVERIKQIPLGGMLAIPGGVIDHEEVLIVKKERSGKLILIVDDGNQEVTPPKKRPITSVKWWEAVCSYKYSGSSFLDAMPYLRRKRTGSFRADHYGSHPGSSGAATCYSSCQWGFFDYFLTQHNPGKGFKGFEKMARLKKDLKRALCHHTGIDDPRIRAFTERALTRDYYEAIVHRFSHRFEAPLLAALQSAEGPLIDRDLEGSEKTIDPLRYFDCKTIVEDELRDQYEKWEIPITDNIRKECEESAPFQAKLRLYRVAELNFPKIAAALSCDPSSPLFAYLQATHEEAKELDQCFVHRVKQTIEIMEASEEDCLMRLTSKVFSWVVRHTRLRYYSYETFPVVAWMHGLNEEAFREVYNSTHATRFLRCLANVEEIQAWAPRLLGLLRDPMYEREYRRCERIVDRLRHGVEDLSLV